MKKWRLSFWKSIFWRIFHLWWIPTLYRFRFYDTFFSNEFPYFNPTIINVSHLMKYLLWWISILACAKVLSAMRHTIYLSGETPHNLTDFWLIGPNGEKGCWQIDLVFETLVWLKLKNYSGTSKRIMKFYNF